MDAISILEFIKEAMKNLEKSSALMQQARRLIPGGVNSPVRAFGAVGGTPPFIMRASGTMIYDIDGNAYIDYVGSWGPMILGHADEKVMGVLRDALSKGTSYGAPTPSELKLAEILTDAFPSMDMVRLVNSGTEATMSAIRLARGFTGRDGIIKFEGCYHGHSDSLLVKAGSGAATYGVPSSPGVPSDLAKHTHNAVYNNLESVEDIFCSNKDTIACVIVEGVPGNMGVVLPENGFLAGLKEISSANGSLLIMDEVMSGFRLCYGGAQKIFDVKPDLTCLGKIIGGGLPIGAFGGRREIMEMLSPAGHVYQAGTLSGNPLAVAAGVKTLSMLREDGVYRKLLQRADELCAGMKDAAMNKNVPVQIAQAGSMFTVFFNEEKVTDYSVAVKSDLELFSVFFNRMLNGGIYLPPSQYEASFVSLAHTTQDIEKTVDLFRASLAK